jgi:hypothetical protein
LQTGRASSPRLELRTRSKHNGILADRPKSRTIQDSCSGSQRVEQSPRFFYGLEASPAGTRLPIFDAGLSNDHTIFGILRAQIRREPLSAEDRRVKADSCELAPDVRCLDRAPEQLGKMRDDFFWGARRREHAPPQIDFEAGESLLCDRWQVRERTISRHQSGAKRSQLSGGQLRRPRDIRRVRRSHDRPIERSPHFRCRETGHRPCRHAWRV